MDVVKDYQNIKEGFRGEEVVRKFLSKQKNCTFTQLDIISKIEDKWYSIEVKHQEMFKAPPFDGHGLPVWQVKMRLQMHDELGIIPLLFVLDKETNILMYESLVNLEQGRKFMTGKKSRIIYHIDGFKRVEL